MGERCYQEERFVETVVESRVRPCCAHTHTVCEQSERSAPVQTTMIVTRPSSDRNLVLDRLEGAFLDPLHAHYVIDRGEWACIDNRLRLDGSDLGQSFQFLQAGGIQVHFR